MSFRIDHMVRTGALIAAAGLLSVGVANAAPVITYDTNVVEWDVGTGQVNGHFVTTSDAAFTGGAIELGMRAEQRSIGGITPSPITSSSYLVQTGSDPNNAARAWWNFHLSANFAGGVNTLDTLVLYIEQQAGTNGAGGTFNLLPFLGILNDDNTPTADSFEASQNAKFAPWFFPTYDLTNTGGFAYKFVLSASNSDGQTSSSVSTEMCVHTAGVNCVPEPSSFSMMGVMAAMLALFGFAGFMRRRQSV